MDAMVTISLDEYEELKNAAAKFWALEACGVDNWDGWSDAMEMLEEDDE